MKVIGSVFCLLFWLTTNALLAQRSEPYLFEEFKSNEQSWPFIGANNDYSIAIEKGHLVMNAKATAIHTYKAIEINEDDDVAYYTNMIFMGGDHTAWIGLHFNMNTDVNKYCSFVYNNDKEFLISERSGKKYEVHRQSKSQVIKPYDYNSLTIIKKGSTYKFLINDKQVHELRIKSFYGSLLGITGNRNTQIKVDEVQVYGPANGRQETYDDESTFLEADVNAKAKKEATPEFQEFMNQFARVAFPYNFNPQNAQGVDVSSYPIVQKTFYKYIASSVRNKQMWAMCQLSDCGEGYALLMMNRYQINQQDISRFFVAVFDPSGKLLQEREVGEMVKENGSFFKMVEFKAYKEGNVMNIEAIETFSNGNKSRNSVRFNTVLCN
ncbi:hypothetical protein SanaruYs_28830 [Chryseotalea sanaruensis]|uniref:DUF1080 domain-containing protein n=1 Tax=Chryseotalea sanaruensis TaxID=2482724 RepID=A0A401UCN2_9BACT|nr:hypothetical protein [Chryseotalea sanaruensis]GCC52646.1 hypothetical protein SanaruYs_28830 [Chryseotalea sanaruensis]